MAQLAAANARPLHPAIPRVLPDGWQIIQRWSDGNVYSYRNGLRVIVDTAVWNEDGGREWMHISISRRDRIPSFDDLKFVKNTFAEKRVAYQVFPPPESYVNLSPFCLHLWVPLTGDPPIPDFGAGGTI